MASNRIEFNLNGRASLGQRLLGMFSRGYQQRLTSATNEGARNGVLDVLDEWKRESVNLAPLEKGTLRRSIKTRVTATGDNVTGEVTASVIEARYGRRFDYAAYLHNVYPRKHGESFANPTTAGTIPRFIDTPLEDHGAQWAAEIERELKATLRRRGFRGR